MATENLEYLDESGLNRTAGNVLAKIAESKAQIEEELNSLSYAKPNGIYPEMTVGAVIGADETAQWATRESEGTGSAIVRSVQGAVEVQDGELVPVQIAGIASTDAQGGELDAIEWTAQTLRAAGSVRDELTANELVTRVGVVDLGTLTWNYNSGDHSRMAAMLAGIIAPSASAVANIACAEYTPVSANSLHLHTTDKSIAIYVNDSVNVYDTAYTDAAAFKSAMDGVFLYYELATPTTTPISPALPMTYRVQQGGTESIIVPDGDISAAPILTVAEPVNMSTELALIWAAIEALQGSRQALQSNVRTDVQEITADLTPIDVTKEVQQTDENREVSE